LAGRCGLSASPALGAQELRRALNELPESQPRAL
jgi:hypothetical protein